MMSGGEGGDAQRPPGIRPRDVRWVNPLQSKCAPIMKVVHARHAPLGYLSVARIEPATSGLEVVFPTTVPAVPESLDAMNQLINC